MGPVYLAFCRMLCSLWMSWELLLVLSMVYMMPRLVPGSLEIFALHLGLSWTGIAKEGRGGEFLVASSSREGGRRYRRVCWP